MCVGSKQTVFLPVPSDPVSNLEVIERTTDSLTLSWTNPHFTGFASITSFRVIITGGGPERSEAFGGDETLTEYTVSSLSPLSFYTISLSAVNDAGLQSLPVIVQESTRSLSQNTSSSLIIENIWFFPY